MAGRPTGAWTFVRPNKYEPGRANIAIYNWDLEDSVTVDVSRVLKRATASKSATRRTSSATRWREGTYDGAAIWIPMTGLKVAAPVGGVPTAPRHSAPEFGAFVLLKKS